MAAGEDVLAAVLAVNEVVGEAGEGVRIGDGVLGLGGWDLRVTAQFAGMSAREDVLAFAVAASVEERPR